MTGRDKKQRGFSIVELLIAGFIFSVVFGVATSTFVNAIRVQKYNMAQHQLLDQTSYAIEYIGRALRMAKTDDGTCGVGNGRNYKVAGSGRIISFKNYNDECELFEWDDFDNDGDFDSIIVTIADIDPANPLANFRLEKVPLNSGNYRVTDARFYIEGELQTDDLQPRVTVFMEFSRDTPISPWGASSISLKVQTTVSQRELDL